MKRSGLHEKGDDHPGPWPMARPGAARQGQPAVAGRRSLGSLAPSLSGLALSRPRPEVFEPLFQHTRVPGVSKNSTSRFSSVVGDRATR
jgi:hypothetical protein